MKRAFYFGCYDGRGHFLRDAAGKSVFQEIVRLIPAALDFPPAWDKLMDTGLLKNGKVPDRPDGRVKWTCARGLWHAFVWWDRSGDSRPGSNSGFYVYGFEPDQAKEAFAFALSIYPEIVKRQFHPLVLVDPKPPGATRDDAH